MWDNITLHVQKRAVRPRLGQNIFQITGGIDIFFKFYVTYNLYLKILNQTNTKWNLSH